MTDATFKAYRVVDEGIKLTFTILTPIPGQEHDNTIFLTDAEVAGVSTGPQFLTLVQTKLRRKLNADGISTKLDSRIGQTVSF